MAVANINVITKADVLAAVPEHWDDSIFESREEYTAFRGVRGEEGSRSLIMEKVDTSAYDRINFINVGRAYGQTITGENTLRGNEMELDVGGFYVDIDWRRGAIGLNKSVKKMSLPQWFDIAADRVGEWSAHEEDDFLLDLFVNPPTIDGTLVTVDNFWPASGISAATSLTASHKLTLDLIRAQRPRILRKGMQPVRVKGIKNANESIDIYIAFIDEWSMYNLTSDDDVQDMLRNTLPEGIDNPIFNGAVGMTQEGILIKPLRSIISECHRGTVLRPECAIVADGYDGGAILTVGDSTKKHDYTKYFPDSGSLFILGDGTHSPQLLTYAGKNTYSFTGVSGGAVANAGSIITLPGGHSRILFGGAQMAAQAWGQKPINTKEIEDYNFKYGIGIELLAGEVPVCDLNKVAANACILNVWAQDPSAIVT